MKTLKFFKSELIRDKECYHQRFDGCPMFVNFITEAEVRKEKRKPKGTEADIRVCFYHGGSGDWYLDMKDVKRGANAMIKLAKTNPNISKKLLAAWKTDEDKFQRFFDEFSKINLKKLSNQSLQILWQKYHVLGVNRFTSSSIIDHFALGTDELIGAMIRKEAKRYIKSESESARVFSTATAPVHQSFINLAEIDLLKILLGRTKESLSDYQKRYFWTKNNYYDAYELSLAHFRQEARAWKRNGKDLAKELKRVEETPIKNKLEKEQLFKRVKFSTLLKNLIRISEDFTWWQDERKRATYLNIHIGYKLLQEIGSRTRFKLAELKYATASEVDNIFDTDKSFRKILVERMKGCAFVADETGYYITIGKAAEKIKKIILGDKDFSTDMDFRGLSASTGKVTGPVRIIMSATEIKKVKPGDILVAVMTRPDYIMGMKKAAAIVTNEGGITSHAAIVSRELGIPCIIGTKIATNVLKDGDMVEVDANHGWVRKLKN